MTWNVHDFYDDKPGNCNCLYEEVPSSAAFSEKARELSAVVSRLQPDIAVFQEVETLTALDEMRSGTVNGSGVYPYRGVVRGNDPRGMNIAWMSKYPTDSMISHKNDSFSRHDSPGEVFRFARDALEMHFTVRGRHIALIGVHFKAKAYPDDPERRLAEAQHTRAIADSNYASDPTASVMILGDFNDVPGSDPVAAIQDGQSGPEYFDALSVLSAAHQYSYVYKGERLLLDHVFLSPVANAALDSAAVEILHGVDVPSDHDPVVATFLIP